MHWKRNLIVSAVGGNYSRLLLCWRGGARFTENQIHGGENFGASRMFEIAGYTWKNRATNVFIDNLYYGGYLYIQSLQTGGGFVFEKNTCYLKNGGFMGPMKVVTELSIKDNTFHLGPLASREIFFPIGKNLPNLGGKFAGRGKYIPPEGKGTGKPVIEKNKFVKMEKWDARLWNHVDVPKLGKLIKKHGRNSSPEDLLLEKYVIRPKSPAKNLKAEFKSTGTVKLTWEASKDPNVIGYIIRYGLKPNSYQNPVFVKNGTSAEINNLKSGQYYFTVSAHKVAFVECWKISNEAIAKVK